MLQLNQEVCMKVDDIFVQYYLFNMSSPVMITFPPGCQYLTQENIDAGKSAWGFDFFTKQQINVIACNHIGADNYFDSTLFADFINTLAIHLAQFPKRLGYGISRGGYAASLYADTLGLDGALLLMPLSTYNPTLAPWDVKVISANKQHPATTERKDAANCSTPLTIIYDPLSPADRKHAERYGESVERIRLPGVGHRISRTLQALGILKSIVLMYQHGEIDKHYFYTEVRRRRQTSFYFKGLSVNPTKKLTLKRLGIIYYHQLRFKLMHIEQQPQKIACRWRDSLRKRCPTIVISYKWLSPLSNNHLMLASGAFVFC